MFLSIGMLKLNYFLADIFILSAEKQPIKLSWRKIECLQQWDIYFGSSWIGITRNCAKYILNQLLTNKSLIRYFKNSYAPDELCVPTIVMNSSFADKAIQVDELDFTKATPLHYLNYVNYIWSYNEKDFTTIMSSGKLFVRKIISGKSEKLIEMIKETWK